MKITIQLNSNNLFDIKLKRAKVLKTIYNATEESIKKYCYNTELCNALISNINEMTELKISYMHFENRKIKFI